MSTRGQLQRATVLLATEDAAVRAEVARVLAGGGIGVTEAAGADEVFRRAAGERPQLVLLAAPLGDLPPAEVGRRLRADPATAGIPVLLLPGADDADTPGVPPALPPADLVAHVRGLLRLHRAAEEARAARREADETRAHLAAVLASSQDAVVCVDREWHVTTWNGAAERLFGNPAAAVVGRPLALPTSPEHLRELEAVKVALARGEAVAPLEMVCVGQGGRRLDLSVRFAAVRDRGGVLAGAAAVIRDVSERRRLEEQVLQAQKMDAVGRLAGGVAHDFNNLLTVVNGYAAMLLEDLADRADSAAHARAILKAGERAAALTQQLLAFGRKQIVATRLLDLNAVVSAAASLLSRLIGDDVRLGLDLQPDLGRVRADPAQLEQVLLNLAGNARDAMPQGGRLTIITREALPGEGGPEARPGPQIVLAVADTGRGMTDEVRRHLFEPFFTTKELGQGTGLGLATVYGIVKQAGGHIDVETGPGAGTTFRVYLPRAADSLSGTDLKSVLPTGAPPPAARQTVLLAEDEDGVRALARQVLVAAGYVVLEARDGDEALRRAEGYAGRIDLLVSDVVMPGLGGRELAERLLARDPALRVLYLSGYTEDEVVRHGVSNAEVQFLPKPFSPAALADKARQVLGAR